MTKWLNIGKLENKLSYEGYIYRLFAGYGCTWQRRSFFMHIFL